MWYASPRALVIRGLVTMAFGLLLLLWPGASLALLVLCFGVFALVDGLLMLATAFAAPAETPGRMITTVAGLAAILVGVLTFFWPGLTAVAVALLIALRALIVGSAELLAARSAHRHGAPAAAPVMLAIGGAISIAFGVLLVVFPVRGLLTVIWVTGFYASILGLVVIANAWRLSRRAATSHNAWR